MNPTTTTTINEEDSIIIRKNVCLTNAMMKKVANYAAQSDQIIFLGSTEMYSASHR